MGVQKEGSTAPIHGNKRRTERFPSPNVKVNIFCSQGKHTSETMLILPKHFYLTLQNSTYSPCSDHTLQSDKKFCMSKNVSVWLCKTRQFWNTFVLMHTNIFIGDYTDSSAHLILSFDIGDASHQPHPHGHSLPHPPEMALGRHHWDLPTLEGSL